MKRLIVFALIVVTPAPTEAQGTLRELTCRGKPGIDLAITARPSPGNARMVRMTLRYTRSTANVGSNLESLAPGSCTWNPFGFSNVPPEPGAVQFDVVPEMQDWFGLGTRQLDTTYLAAAFFADTISIPRYLTRSELFWRFFVDDRSSVATSHGATRNSATRPTYATITGAFGNTTPSVAELRCRGGRNTLFFGRGSSAGDNRINMYLRYRIAEREAGPEAGGLAAGTCAWVRRKGLKPETGQINFVTAGNAQLAQARSGGSVDRSPTAAARFPDANTIPAYMENPAHYWNFQVTTAEPTSARSHAAWRVPIIGTLKPGGATDRYEPPRGTIGTRERTGSTSSADVARLVDPRLIFRELIRKPNEYWMRFSARARSGPSVEYSTEAPVRVNGRLGFRSPMRMTVREGAQSNYSSEYSTRPVTNLPMATKYYFVINVPQGAEGQSAREYTGEFTTINQMVVVRFTRIDVLNDSDKGGAGDLAFRFFMAPSPNRNAECAAQQECDYQIDHVERETGQSHNMDYSLFMYMPGPKVRAWVNGADDDSRISYVPRTVDAQYGMKGTSSYLYDRNTASGEFDLTRYRPGVKYPFKLRSVDGSVFMFEVHGDIELRWR